MNSSDPKIRGRINGMMTRGESKGTAKLNTQAVLEIRTSREPSPTVARRYGICDRYVRAIRHGDWWKHV